MVALYRLPVLASWVHVVVSERRLAHFTKRITLSVQESTDWTSLLASKWGRNIICSCLNESTNIIWIFIWHIVDAFIADADITSLLIRRCIIANRISPLVLNILRHNTKVLIWRYGSICSLLSVWNIALRCEWVHLEGVVWMCLLNQFDFKIVKVNCFTVWINFSKCN